jgi:hypothetical protein
MSNTLGTVQNTPAQPVCFYTSTSARCWCGETITLRVDGQWWHGPVQGFLCREPQF